MNIVSALYEISYSCEDGLCTPGAKVSFEIKLIHINLSTKYTSIKILDEKENVLGIKTNLDLVVTPEQNESTTILGFIPDSEESLNLFPCFTFIPLDNLDAAEETTCGKDIFILDINSLAQLQCETDDDCSEGRVCDESLCKKLICNDCQFIQNHRCFSFECCNDGSCASNEICTDNRCNELICDENAYADNHECITLECRENEYKDGKRCKRLRCKSNEYIKNHECKKLSCNFFQEPKENKCGIDFRLIIKITLALGVTAVVLGIFYVKKKQE